MANQDGVLIEVTEEDIGTPGKRDEDGRCMMDRAFSRTFNGYASVGIMYAHVDGADYELPDVAQNAILAWDSGKTVEPFTFTAKLAL